MKRQAGNRPGTHGRRHAGWAGVPRNARPPEPITGRRPLRGGPAWRGVAAHVPRRTAGDRRHGRQRRTMGVRRRCHGRCRRSAGLGVVTAHAPRGTSWSAGRPERWARPGTRRVSTWRWHGPLSTRGLVSSRAPRGTAASTVGPNVGTGRARRGVPLEVPRACQTRLAGVATARGTTSRWLAACVRRTWRRLWWTTKLGRRRPRAVVQADLRLAW